jgi:hypothetical protein
MTPVRDAYNSFCRRTVPKRTSSLLHDVFPLGVEDAACGARGGLSRGGCGDAGQDDSHARDDKATTTTGFNTANICIRGTSCK